jgi:hypothetical protein
LKGVTVKNIYQAVLDDADEKRRRLFGGYEPSPELVEKVKRYLREREERRAMEQLGKPKERGNHVGPCNSTTRERGGREKRGGGDCIGGSDGDGR